MKRKVVQHGPGTVIISLPSRWVKKYNIAKGSELDVNEEDNRIIVSTEIGDKPQEAKIDLTGLDRTSIIYIIRGLYRLGYDTIEATFNNPLAAYPRENSNLNVLSVIHAEVNRLIGYEIVQEREKFCVIKDLQTISSKDFDQILRRVFLLLIDTSQDFLEGIKTNNRTLLETIENKHDTITKFVSYCLRILNKKGHPEQRKTSYYYNVISFLDQITDILKHAARDALKFDRKFQKESIEVVEIVTEDIRKYYELFYNFSNQRIAEINARRYAAETRHREMPSIVKKPELIIVTNIFQALEILLHLIEARTAIQY